jgi:hypothetical protein
MEWIAYLISWQPSGTGLNSSTWCLHSLWLHNGVRGEDHRQDPTCLLHPWLADLLAVHDKHNSRATLKPEIPPRSYLTSPPGAGTRKRSWNNHPPAFRILMRVDMWQGPMHMLQWEDYPLRPLPPLPPLPYYGQHQAAPPPPLPPVRAPADSDDDVDMDLDDMGEWAPGEMPPGFHD